MSYVLQAIVGTEKALAPMEAPQLPLVHLAQGMVLIPLSEATRREHSIPGPVFVDGGSNKPVPEPLRELCCRLSKHGRVAYVEAEYWAGDGGQAMVLAEHGEITDGPVVGPHQINVALQFIGVQAGTSRDEFEALGLGRFRHTEEWTTEDASAEPPN